MLRDIAARHVRAAHFTAARPWGALDSAAFDTADRPVSARLYWTDQPYRWHVNDGDEVFGEPLNQRPDNPSRCHSASAGSA
jgi:hypothetical protein